MRADITKFRVKILQTIDRVPPGFRDHGWTGGMLVAELGIPETTLRRHVRALRDAGLVQDSMTGYRLPPGVSQRLDLVLQAAREGKALMVPPA